MSIPLGVMARDKVTGFTGVVDNKAEFMHGCDRYYLQPKVDKDGKKQDGALFDEPQIEIVRPVKVVMQPPSEPPTLCAMGQKVLEPITGIKGTICGRAIYLNGCSRVFIVPLMNEKGVDLSFWVDEPQVEILGANLMKENAEAPKEPTQKTGGPAPSCSSRPSQY